MDIKVRVIADLGEFKRQVTKAAGTTQTGGTAGTGKGFAKDILGKIGIPLGAGAAITTIITILKSINDRIAETVNQLKDASPAFKGIQDTLDKTFSMAMKPLGDILSIFLKPYLALQMKRLRAGLEEASGIIKGIKKGTISETVGAERIGKIVEEMVGDFAYIQGEAQKLTKGIVAPIAGFEAGVKLANTTFLEGLDKTVLGFFEGITKNFGPIPESLANFILDESKKKPSYIQDLPQSIAGDFGAWFAVKKSSISDIPEDIKKSISTWINDPKNEKAITESLTEWKNKVDLVSPPLATLATILITGGTDLSSAIQAAINKISGVSIPQTPAQTPLPSGGGAGNIDWFNVWKMATFPFMFKG